MQIISASLLETILVATFFFTSTFLYAQKDFNFSGHSIGVGGVYTLKNRVSPVPDGVDGVLLGTRGQAGFEVNLSKIISIKSNWSVDLSYVFGAYPFDLKYDIKKEFTGGEEDFSNLPNSIDYIKYTGVEIGLLKFFEIKKNLFSINGGCAFTYFMGDWTFQERYEGDIPFPPGNLVYKRLFIPNRDGNIIVAPSLKLDYYKNIKNRLWLYTFLTGTLSSKKILNGTYNVIGKNKILNGTFDKKYAHVGVGVGVHYMKKEK